MVLGVAGKYCAGKDTVVILLMESGFIEINMDALGHRALEAKKAKIVAAFGTPILSKTGTIDRKVLSGIVFSNPAALASLESIVHPWMREETGRLIGETPRRNMVINAALLFHMKLDAFCDAVLWVTAPLLHRIKRAKSRDNIGTADAIKRIWAQRSLNPQNSGNPVDIYKVVNKGDRKDLEKQIRTLVKVKGL